MHVLFKTVHGSHLYGLAHENSDEDYYTVISKVKQKKARYTKQSIHDGVDSVVVDFGTWVEACRKGVPQALEAMFSEMAIVDEITAFRTGFRVGTEVYDTYMRTIKAFCMEEDDAKKKRHGIRLALNFRDLREYGRFNPTLSPVDAELATELAKLPNDYVYNDALKIAWS